MLVRFTLALLCLTISCFAQDAAQGPDGTGQISGRVLASDTNQPLDHVQVSVSLSNLNPPQWTRPVVTNKDGHYEIDWLPAASFLVQATLDGFVSQTFHDPANPDPVASQVVTLPDAAAVANIDFSLSVAGSLHGAVLDSAGGPVAEGVSVSAVQQADDKSWHTISTTHTDASGHFSLTRLAPGTYIVCVNGPRDVSPSKTNITYRETCLGDTPTPANSEPAEVHANDSGPDLHLVAPRIPGHTLTLIPVWPASPDTSAPRPDHYTAQLLHTGYTATPAPDNTLLIPNLPAGRYHALLSAWHGTQLLATGEADIDLTTADLHQKVPLKLLSPNTETPTP